MIRGSISQPGFHAMTAVERYHPAPDQLALASTMGDALATLLPLGRLHGCGQETAATWAAFEALGLFGMSLPEDRGGSGLGAVEEALIAIELGRRLASPSVFATIGANHANWTDGGRRDSGSRLAAGYLRDDRVVTVADSEASLLLLRSAGEARIVALPRTNHTLDERHWSAELQESPPPGPALAEFDTAGMLRLRLNDAAALAGMAQAAVDMAVGYARLREQFGRPIGSFQAVKHHCANMAIAARSAQDLASFAAVALDDQREDAAFQVESAFFVAGSAALSNAGKNIQIHGGIGFSAEAEPHLIVKRTQLAIAVAGGLEAANLRLARLPAHRRGYA
jgi:alkylation response protein AidB-like acyl-CoA dehydrogenase